VKHISFISIIVLLLVVSCNYIPFPCNLKPNTEQFEIDPIERNYDQFEILRDTVITSENINPYKGTITGLAYNDLNVLENRKHGICVYRKTQKDNFSKKVTHSKTIVTHSAKQNGEKFIETKSITYTIENTDSFPVQSLPEIVKNRKHIHIISITISKMQEQS
jgi:hypothetical protein